MMGWGFNGAGNCFGFAGAGGWGGLLGFLIQLTIVLLIVFAAFKLFKNTTNQAKQNNHALSILEERFVRGEINEEDFVQKKEVLKS